MKGDPSEIVRCPLCSVIIMSAALHRNAMGWTTTRTKKRQALSSHLHRRHPELGLREASLVLDEAVDGCLTT